MYRTANAYYIVCAATHVYAISSWCTHKLVIVIICQACLILLNRGRAIGLLLVYILEQGKMSEFVPLRVNLGFKAHIYGNFYAKRHETKISREKGIFQKHILIYASIGVEIFIIYRVNVENRAEQMPTHRTPDQILKFRAIAHRVFFNQLHATRAAPPAEISKTGETELTGIRPCVLDER